jgi:hypothetical protein
MAIGPFAGGAAFAAQLTRNPWEVVGWTLLYELMLLVFGFVTRVWEQLQIRWLGPVADWCDGVVQNILAGYRKRYLRQVVYLCRFFDVKGLNTQGVHTLELRQVFVELTLAPQAAQRASSDPLRVMPEVLRQGAHPIWDYLVHIGLNISMAMPQAVCLGRST